MRFNSINEYFYKLYSATLVILLPPILAFATIYLLPAKALTNLSDEPEAFIGITTSLLLTWALLFIFFNKKIKSLRNVQGLRQKLDKYFELTIVRYTIFCITGVSLAVGFHFLRNDLFTALFVIQLLMCAVLWPSAKKVSRDLRLRGDEHQMVFYKKDTL